MTAAEKPSQIRAPPVLLWRTPDNSVAKTKTGMVKAPTGWTEWKVSNWKRVDKRFDAVFFSFHRKNLNQFNFFYDHGSDGRTKTKDDLQGLVRGHERNSLSPYICQSQYCYIIQEKLKCWQLSCE